MSMSVPLLWQTVVWQAGWGAYRGRDLAGHEIVDGGLLSNFPIELFVSKDEAVIDVMGPKTSENVLGMLIDETISVPGAEIEEKRTNSLNAGELYTVQRLSNLINTTLSARDKWVIDAFENQVVRLPAKGYGTTEFDMTEERQTRLVNAGKAAMEAYFENAQAALQFTPFDLAIDDRPQRVADQVAQKILKE
jgi:predicted acylesterase/phospholipase RssA